MPALVSVIGYVAAAPFRDLPNFSTPLGVAPLTGTDSINQSSVLSAATAVVFHTCDRSRRRGDICTGTPAVDAVAFSTISPSVDVVASAVRCAVAVNTVGLALHAGATPTPPETSTEP